VELADGRVAGKEELGVDELVLRPDALGGLPGGELEHRLAPGPEVAARRAPPQRPLEAVAVSVDEARERERAGHLWIVTRLAPGR
jgi:hypothetical protein